MRANGRQPLASAGSDAAPGAATSQLHDEEVPDAVAMFGALATRAEESRTSTETKFLLAYAAFAGRPPDRSRAPYQDFELLMRLRGLIVHAKPVEEIREGSAVPMVFSPPLGLVRALEQRRISADFGAPDVSAGALSWISTQAAARWACNTAAAMVRSVLDLLPASNFKQMMELFYSSIRPVR